MIVRLGDAVRAFCAIVVAFVVTGLIFQATGSSMSAVLSGSLDGAIRAPGALTTSLRWALPLALIAAGALVCLTAGYFNVGAQGQFYMGAICTYAVVSNLGAAPPEIRQLLGVCAGVAAGAMYSLIPGVLRLWKRTDEVLTTLMLNFVAILFLNWATTGPFHDPAGTGQAAESPLLPADVRLSDARGVSAMLVIVTCACLAATWFLLSRTSFGIQARLMGRNPLMARWQGVEPRRIGVIAFLLAGATAGLAGALMVLGPVGQIQDGFMPDLGFTALVVVLVGLMSVPGLVAAALFFGGLHAAVAYLPIVTDLPPAALSVLQGVVALLVTVRYVPRVLAAKYRWPRVWARAVTRG